MRNQTPQAGTNRVFMHLEWVVPEHTLAFSIRSKSGVLEAGEYVLDDASGKLMTAAVAGHANTVGFGTCDATDTQVTEYWYSNNLPSRESLSVRQDGSLGEHEQDFQEAAWRDKADVTLVEVDRATLESSGLVRKHR